MADKKSVNLLPEYLRSDKNAKFLSSTIDQFIQTPQLERIDGYVGSKVLPNYDAATDFYINESLNLRKNYQLQPALVFKDVSANISDVVGYDDLLNELAIQGSNTSNLDKLLRAEFYSYDPLIDWDKLINYSDYYWLPTGPEVIVVDNTELGGLGSLIGEQTATLPYTDSASGELYQVSNGMKLVFTDSETVDGVSVVAGREYLVEGVGNSINLVDFDKLEIGEKFAQIYNETFDSDPFDDVPFDSDKKLPVVPEYITINRSSKDLNSWTRYNRWFHKDIIRITAEIAGIIPSYNGTKAQRPIIEFKPNLQLYNFGVNGVVNVDVIDTTTEDALNLVDGTFGYYVDEVLLEQGHRVIFNADTSELVRSKVYLVNYVNGILQLVEDTVPVDGDAVSVTYGTQFSGSSWYYDSSSVKWMYAQQHDTLNQAPLFELYTNDGIKYTDPSLINDFKGSKIFGYSIGTGAVDSVLGFPLSYEGSYGVGSYLFSNYFMTDVINVTENNISVVTTTGNGYLKINNIDGTSDLTNVWKETAPYQIPIIEIRDVVEPTSEFELLSLTAPIDLSASVTVYVNAVKVDATVSVASDVITVSLLNPAPANSVVKFEILADQSPNENGFYDTPLSVSNNPLNGPISKFTLSELSDHLSTMVSRIDGFTGVSPGTSNLRDFDNYTRFGTRFIINANPIVFSEIFLGKKEHNVVDAIRFAADQYNQFKMNMLRALVAVDDQLTPADALDYVLKTINKNKDNKSPYYRSDMMPYGSDKIVKEYTVGVVVNYEYPVSIDFNPSELSFKSVLIYLNDIQLVYGKDYEFNLIDNSVVISHELVTGDVIKICTYSDTLGSFIPSTPSKLGLFPKFKPELYIDNSYVSGPVTMIRGHDGSVMVAYNDYRDAILLEYETRIFNNIKTSYNQSVLDITASMPGAFRNEKFSIADATAILRKDFIKWASVYNVDIANNSTFDEGNAFTWNFVGSVDTVFGNQISGSWRSLYNYFYDTDRPHTHPWEMLGFTEEPNWWNSTYGSAPYTSTNSLLWNDLKNGFVRGTGETRLAYARPDLLDIIPVNSAGGLKTPDLFLASPNSYQDKQADWVVGDYSPAETAWRRSSYWPFVINTVAALLNPSSYSTAMYDTSRVSINQLGQLVYSNDLYLNPTKISIEGINGEQIAGFGTFIIDKGTQKDLNYLSSFKSDIDYLTINLFHKLGGFASKEKLQVVIDAIDPKSTGQSAIMPPEDYSLILNVSNPIKSARISGIIIQKSNGSFLVKGYDRTNPYFEILKPIKTAVSGSVTVGGISAPFTEWSGIENNGNSGLSSIDLVSAKTNTTRYYKQGQIVRYNNRFYRVKVSHTALPTFDSNLFQQLSALPVTGGATVQTSSKFETNVTQVPYGTTYSTIQEVYDLIAGYGAYLESQGFVFDQYNKELFETIDWKFTGKEFLFWTTQNWSNGNLITLSPFANTLKYQFNNSVVDNISTGDYEYSLLKADGKSFPISKFNLSREDGYCTINTLDTEEGIFFAVLNSVQKEHAMVFNNTTIFNDTIYDIESGYKQQRIKLSGFRTANWNGDLYSPGFVYDSVEISNWVPYTMYKPGVVVRYNGTYYQSTEKINGDATFDFNKWSKLSEKPASQLLPNFDYKINQFEDFYSLDIDNFDAAQQQLSQHLLGYTQRPYLTNILTNQTTQYKFYQGFIREKGTRNSIDKISKAGKFSRNGSIDFNEEWAFRIGHFGGFETYKEIEFALEESNALENPYVVKFTDESITTPSSLINYTPSSSLLVSPNDYVTSSTFEVYPTTNENLKLTTAGYVKVDDVTATAYNKNSLLDIANNSLINEGDTIWLGFLENNDWTVYRYSRQTAKISGVFVSAPAEEITFVTDLHHSLQVDDIISVVNFNDQVNGVYIVKSIPELNQFTVSSKISTIVNEELLSYGALFKFTEARYSDFEKVADEKDLIKLNNGEKIWVDSNADGRWSVYEKLKNYNTGISFNSVATPAGQELGHTIFASDTTPVVLVSAPSWNLPTYDSHGRILVFENVDQILEKQYEYNLNTNGNFYCEPNTSTSFGYSLAYDIEKSLYLVGAPTASKVRYDSVGTVVYSTGTGTAKTFDNEGLVKISSRAIALDAEVTERVLLSPYSYSDTQAEAANSRFGHSIYVNNVGASSSSTLLISAPGDGVNNTGIGRVFAYYINTSTSAPLVNISQHSAGISLAPHGTTVSKMQWGYKIAGDRLGKVIAISAPSWTSGNNTGMVQIFDESLQWKQTLTSPFGTNDAFGDDVVVSSSGKFLIISSIAAQTPGTGVGKVAIYTTNTSGVFVLSQIIDNPLAVNDLTFGHSISLSNDETVLVISSLGKNRSQFITFDETTRPGETTFDQTTTRFHAPVKDAGAVYVFNNLSDYFIQAEELVDATIVEGSRYGKSVVATADAIYVGAPWYSNTVATDDSTFYQFNKTNLETNTWKLLQLQPDVVNIDTVKRVILINSIDEEIIDYLDVIDPVKGKIAGIADQELKYKSAFDPAIYSIGIQGAVVDTETNWIDEQVGELWWDLSTAKYTWYEQGDDIFRKNNWGKLFPGASIDVYEWVKSDLLPSEWAAQADTNDGLTNGISGQPKYPDNSVISVKQLFNTVTNSFENVYYFWVKNKVIVPSAKNRRISAYQVASLISDPVSNGLKFAEILSSDSVAFANIQPMLVGNYINANIATDTINNKIPRHTEWVLLEEGNANSVPNTLLTKKLFDSLLGHDSQGQVVPSLDLTYRNKFGLGIRPQQTLFNNRIEALRNVVEFTNSVLIKNLITGNYSFANLNKEEPIPDDLLREYDLLVEDLDALDQVDATYYERAVLECSTENGKVTSVSIVSEGFGYSLPPAVTVITTTGQGAVIQTEIDSNGRVIAATIESAGSNYIESNPVVVVRPHTVIVQVNGDYGDRWSKHAYDYDFNTWVRVKTQIYNTKDFWEYVDWVKDTYDGYKDYKYVLNDSYELSKLVDMMPGDYVKINNIGDGRFAILEKLADGSVGDFSTSYNIVYSERGTIQILDSIWDFSKSNYAYDIASLEETLYDQLPDLELSYILIALKDDIFVRDLKVNWNLFFFKAVKYALTEQKLLDWAFKTSFITISNQIGELTQPSVYRIDNEESFEEYIKEVKPYRTKIRSYTSSYTAIDNFGDTWDTTTDFDLPSYFNSLTNQYEVVTLDNNLMNESPWKWWFNNYTCYVGRIEVGHEGSGYTQTPTVVITTAEGDEGSGATAEAYIRRGKLYSILVTNPGSGYVIPPVITIVGGGASVTSVATASAVMANDTIRKNLIEMKFDRVSVSSEINNEEVTYTFPPCSGVDNKFVLPWLASPDKTTIVPLLDGKLVLSTDYTIEYYTEVGDTYTKHRCRFVFLNYVPTENQIFKITYRKNIDLYTAVDRITNFYKPTDDMPGLELPLLMSGAENGSRQIQGLSFGYSPVWGQGIYDTNTVWADLVDYYTSVKLVSNLTTGTSTLTVDSTNGIVVGQRVTLSNTSTNYFRPNTVVTSVNSTASTITISDARYEISRIEVSSATNESLFYTVDSFNTYITVGDIAIISGTDNSSVLSNVDGTYTVTGVGVDKFTATKSGTITVSADIRAFNSTASVYIPSVLGNFNSSSTYRIAAFTETVSETPIAIFDIGTALETVSAISVYYTPTVGSPSFIGQTPSAVTEWYSLTETSSGTYVTVYNLGTAVGNIHTFDISVYSYPALELWKDNFVASDLDTELSAGSWNSAGEFVGALGVNPTDVLVNGSSFLNPELGYAPEELVKGQTLESVGISVYTQNEDSSALAVTGSYPVYNNKSSIIEIGQSLEDAVGVMVHYNGKVLTRVTNPPNPDDVGPYYSIVNIGPRGQGGTTFVNSEVLGQDTFLGPYDLGFEWNMYGETSSQVYIGSNGYLTFGSGALNLDSFELTSLPIPAIFMMSTDLWQSYGPLGQGLTTGEVPGFYISTGTVENSNFKFWRLMFLGSLADYALDSESIILPTISFEVTLYSDGDAHQYVEIVYSILPDDLPIYYFGIASANGTQVATMPDTPANAQSYVYYSKKIDGIWNYVGGGSFDTYKYPYSFTGPDQYFIAGGTLIVAPQVSSGRGGYTLMQMGGDYVIDSNMVVTSTSTALVSSSALIDNVKSVLVTVDGDIIEEMSSDDDYGYKITTTGSANNRAAVAVYNIPYGYHTVQAWFLKSNHPKFNRMYSDHYGPLESSTANITLTNPPGVIEPVSSQVIVEQIINGDTRRLKPPPCSYYTIQSDQTIFSIDDNFNRPSGFYNYENVKVYGNGVLLRPGFDYSLDTVSNSVNLSAGLLVNGDSLVIENYIFNDYVIVGNLLILSSPPPMEFSLNVISFTDHDNMAIHTEVFPGSLSHRFVLDIPAISEDYVWVYINGIPLSAGVDYELLEDLRTVQIRTWKGLQTNDEVIITSINGLKSSNVVVGYRIFKDIFDRVQYTRIADSNSTRLSKELTFEDSEIHVYDSSRLIPPNPYKNKPGVVFIDSERIEFFEKKNNILSNLRRSTMGTGPAKFSEIGTKVVDQSPQQYILSQDAVYRQYHITSSTVDSRVLTTVTNTVNTYTFVISTSGYTINTGTMYESNGDGITLSTDTTLLSNGLTIATNQVIVKYGGRILRKTTATIHDPLVSYDLIPESSIILQPEFIVEYNTMTGYHELSLTVDGFNAGVRVDIEQKVGHTWTTGSDSILTSDSVQAKFLRDRTTSLPDSEYYGGSPVLTDDNNFDLTDDNNNPLEGY